jgi:hypothetical protein
MKSERIPRDKKVRGFGSVATVSRCVNAWLTLGRIIRTAKHFQQLIHSIKWTMQAIVL